MNVIIERDEFHTTTATYTRGLGYGGGIGSIISVARQLEDNHRGKRRGHKRWGEEFTTYYYHYDGIGTVTALTDDEGDVVQEYTYDAYGNILAVEDDEIINPYRFSTKEYDSRSGLIYFGARYYDPRIGRFITPDPLTWGPDDPRIFSNPLMLVNFLPAAVIIHRGTLTSDLFTATPIAFREFQRGILNYMGTSSPKLLHRYIYCFNSPVNWIDPLGLKAKIPWWKKWHIDIGFSGSATGHLGPGVTVGLQLGPTGIYFYYGFGLGIGAGGSATFNPGTVPSPGISVNVTGRGGKGLGAQGTVSASTSGVKGTGGIGIGLGTGVTVTVTHTITIIGGR
ncbi:hypothetical protein M1N42_03545 [Thermodesulfovibrionales bacterium]|nr:hypothetical protein [Thermodesulfovibrionales bacterium]